MDYTLREVVMKQSVRRSILVASFTVTAGACAPMELEEPQRTRSSASYSLSKPSVETLEGAAASLSPLQLVRVGGREWTAL